MKYTKKISSLALIMFFVTSMVFASMPVQQEEPIYVGPDFFNGECSAENDVFGIEGIAPLSGGCYYYCSWCITTGYSCDSGASCC